MGRYERGHAPELAFKRAADVPLTRTVLSFFLD
jgi:hypothetical protein